MGYLLLTVYPLCSSKTFCLTFKDVEDKLNHILDETERYWQELRVEYETKLHPQSWEYEGIHIINIDFDRIDVKKVFGEERKLSYPSYFAPRVERTAISKYRRIINAEPESNDQEDEAQTGLEERSSTVA